MQVPLLLKVFVLTLWHPAAFGDFREKNTKTHVALRKNFSGPVRATDLVKGSKDAASLVACTRKKFFGWGLQIFCEWRHKWRTFRPPWPTLPGPGHQLLDGNISLKCILETRLQPESFDTLDDLLRFQVQKLWSKAVLFNLFVNAEPLMYFCVCHGTPLKKI